MEWWDGCGVGVFSELCVFVDGVFLNIRNNLKCCFCSPLKVMSRAASLKGPGPFESYALTKTLYCTQTLRPVSRTDVPLAVTLTYPVALGGPT